MDNYEYKIKIDEFEGPFDLLLHLIKENDIDIYDIKIEKITREYLKYIKKMKELNLTVESGYLVMACELLEIKSKMLLPKKEENKEEDLYEENPKELLVQRILTYKKYKEITEELKKYEEKRKEIYIKEPENLKEYAKDEDNSSDLNLEDLMNAFNEIIKRKEQSIPLQTKITKKELSVSQRVFKIRSILKEKKTVRFEELFDASSKEEIIVSFLSILEMFKKNEIIIKQDANFKFITVSLKDGG